MYLFLHPITSLLISNWCEIVKPRELLSIEKKETTYRQKIEDRMESLAKKYKELYINTKGAFFRTFEMIYLEERMEELTDTLEKFEFIEKYDEILAEKELDTNIVILKKGEKCEHMIRSLKELKEILPYIRIPTRKRINVNLITQKQQLDRKYTELRREVIFYGLIEKEISKETILLEELCSNVSRTQKNEKMDLEFEPSLKQEENMKLESQETFKSSKKVDKIEFGRNFLYPRVVNLRSRLPLKIEEVEKNIAEAVNFKLNLSENCKMINEDTQSQSDFSKY